ncbi:uncharacterized protein LOC116307651 isoform X2 [Actinia tenebrosa]|nr:uncharacterized protein LOC116307651 isoform X2 [Actinia tenebrosa]
MVNHVIKVLLTNTDTSCRIKCHLIKKCVSYNLGPSTTPGMMVCQLNDADRYQHPQDYQDKPGFSYRGIKNACVRSQCVANAKREFTKIQEQCVCFSGFGGKNCKEVPLDKEWIKLNDEAPVCAGGKDNAFGTVKIPYDCEKKQLKVVHVSNEVSLKNATNRAENFGDKRIPEAALFIIISDTNNNVILPSYSNSSCQSSYFKADNITVTSPELIYSEPFASPKGNEIRIWFGRVLHGTDDEIYKSTSCVDAYIRNF